VAEKQYANSLLSCFGRHRVYFGIVFTYDLICVTLLFIFFIIVFRFCKYFVKSTFFQVI